MQATRVDNKIQTTSVLNLVKAYSFKRMHAYFNVENCMDIIWGNWLFIGGYRVTWNPYIKISSKNSFLWNFNQISLICMHPESRGPCCRQPRFWPTSKMPEIKTKLSSGAAILSLPFLIGVLVSSLGVGQFKAISKSVSATDVHMTLSIFTLQVADRRKARHRVKAAERTLETWSSMQNDQLPYCSIFSPERLQLLSQD